MNMTSRVTVYKSNFSPQAAMNESHFSMLNLFWQNVHVSKGCLAYEGGSTDPSASHMSRMPNRIYLRDWTGKTQHATQKRVATQQVFEEHQQEMKLNRSTYYTILGI